MRIVDILKLPITKDLKEGLMIGGYHQLGIPKCVVVGDNQGNPWPA